MKYKPKFQECPYRTANGRCTHKHVKKRVSKRKRLCGYSKPSQCEMYLEWYEMRSIQEKEERLIPTPINLPKRLNLKRSEL